MPRAIPAVAALIAALLGGCSYLVTRSPGSNYQPAEQPRCGTSRAAPAVDTVVGIAGALFAFSMFSQDCNDDEDGICDAIFTTFGTMGVLTAALWGTGALTGFSRTGDCREAHAQHLDYIKGLQQPGSDNPWEAPIDWDQPQPVPANPPADSKDAIHSELCQRWRARIFAAPIGEARLEVIKHMPRECHE